MPTPAKKPTAKDAVVKVVDPAPKGLTVLVDGKVGDGLMGYLEKGAEFVPGKGCDVEGLKEKGLIG